MLQTVERLLQYLTVGRNGDHLPRDHLSAGLQSSLYRVFNTAAARNLHSYHGYALNIIVTQDFRQFLAVFGHIQLGTTDKRHMVLDKALMKVAVCKSGTIRRDKQLRLMKIGRVYRNKLDLHRPLTQV